jgi:hypothetical protein
MTGSAEERFPTGVLLVMGVNRIGHLVIRTLSLATFSFGITFKKSYSPRKAALVMELRIIILGMRD